MASKWIHELEMFNGIYPCFIVEGDVTDCQLYQGELCGFPEFLSRLFEARGYPVDHQVFFNYIAGPSQDPFELNYQDRNLSLSSATALNLCELLDPGREQVVIVELASYLVDAPDRLSVQERKFFDQLKRHLGSLRVRDGQRMPTLVFLVNRVSDLPVSFYLNNDTIRILTMDRPSHELRREWFTRFFADGAQEANAERFSDLTEGYTNRDLYNLLSLHNSLGGRLEKLNETVLFHKYGEQEDRWRRPEMFKRIAQLESEMRRGIKGQDEAIHQISRIMRRIALGFSGLQSGKPVSNKPRGLFMCVGPTGVGKTESVRSLCRTLFGDDSACIRFDMSEFREAHADQRLFGAPPGYVGYEQGGELTKLVKERPFSLILFDEFEKAHPSIWYKFLQVLEDGRLTDSHGETVFFGQTVIAFTTNIGNARAAEEYERCVRQGTQDEPETRRMLRGIYEEEVKTAFADKREILNRMGDNLIYYSFLSADTHHTIIDSLLSNVSAKLRSQFHLDAVIEPSVSDYLTQLAAGRKGAGGRGLLSLTESQLINEVSDLVCGEIDAGLRPLKMRITSDGQGIQCKVLHRCDRRCISDDALTYPGCYPLNPCAMAAQTADARV